MLLEDELISSDLDIRGDEHVPAFPTLMCTAGYLFGGYGIWQVVEHMPSIIHVGLLNANEMASWSTAYLGAAILGAINIEKEKKIAMCAVSALWLATMAGFYTAEVHGVYLLDHILQ